MQISDKLMAEFKAICDKEGYGFTTEEEYREAAYSLVTYAEIVYKVAVEEAKRQSKLKENPNGFEFEGEGRTCPLCLYSGSQRMWYDKWGMKCLDCQRALEKKVIPGYVFKDRDNNRHVTASMLSWKYNIHHNTIKKLVRRGQLKPRVVESGHGDTLVFLRRENNQLPAIINSYSKSKVK